MNSRITKDQMALLQRAESFDPSTTLVNNGPLIEGCAAALYAMYNAGITTEQLNAHIGSPSRVVAASRNTNEQGEVFYEVRFLSGHTTEKARIYPGKSVSTSPSEAVMNEGFNALLNEASIKFENQGIREIRRTAGGYTIDLAEGVEPRHFTNRNAFTAALAQRKDCSLVEADALAGLLDDNYYASIGGDTKGVSEVVRQVLGDTVASISEGSGRLSIRIKPGAKTVDMNKGFAKMNEALILRGWKGRMLEAHEWSCQRLIVESDARKRAFKTGIPYPAGHFMAQSTDAVLTPSVGDTKVDGNSGAATEMPKDGNPSILDLMNKDGEKKPETLEESDARKRAQKAGVPYPEEHFKAQSTDAVLQPKVGDEDKPVNEGNAYKKDPWKDMDPKQVRRYQVYDAYPVGGSTFMNLLQQSDDLAKAEEMFQTQLKRIAKEYRDKAPDYPKYEIKLVDTQESKVIRRSSVADTELTENQDPHKVFYYDEIKREYISRGRGDDSFYYRRSGRPSNSEILDGFTLDEFHKLANFKLGAHEWKDVDVFYDNGKVVCIRLATEHPEKLSNARLRSSETKELDEARRHDPFGFMDSRGYTNPLPLLRKSGEIKAAEALYNYVTNTSSIWEKYIEPAIESIQANYGRPDVIPMILKASEDAIAGYKREFSEEFQQLFPDGKVSKLILDGMAVLILEDIEAEKKVQASVKEPSESLDEAKDSGSSKIVLTPDHELFDVLKKDVKIEEAASKADVTKDDPIFSPLERMAKRELLKYAVATAIMCPYTKKILDVRDSILLTISVDGKDIASTVMNAKHWDNVSAAANAAVLEKHPNAKFEVLDGRILYGGRKASKAKKNTAASPTPEDATPPPVVHKGPGEQMDLFAKGSRGKVKKGIKTTEGVEVPEDNYIVNESTEMNVTLSPIDRPAETFIVDRASLIAERADKWSSEVETSWHPPEGLFTKSSEEIAKTIVAASTDLRQALSRLTFYMNRAGKNLSQEDRMRLRNAVGLIRRGEVKNENLREALGAFVDSDDITFNKNGVLRVHNESCIGTIHVAIDESGTPYITRARLNNGQRTFNDMNIEAFGNHIPDGKALAQAITEAIQEIKSQEILTEGKKIFENWQREFSDFQSMPAEIDTLIKDGTLLDVSYRQDMSPSFEFGKEIPEENVREYRLWVDFADPEEREFANKSKRYSIYQWVDGEGHDKEIMDTDDIKAIVAKIQELAAPVEVMA